MQNHNKPRILIVAFICAGIVLLSCCGRKQKNIFQFSDESISSTAKLSLPIIKGLAAHTTINGYSISWFEVKIDNAATQLIGYNVYRLVRTNIIPKHPLNNKPLKEPLFLDTKKIDSNKPAYYLVRGVFCAHKKIIEGPASNIVQAK